MTPNHKTSGQPLQMESMKPFFSTLLFLCMSFSMQGQPGFSKSFNSNSIGPGSISTLTFSINNSGNSSAVTDLDFTDNLPAGMTIADPPNAIVECSNGTLTAVAGSSTITYTGGAVGANSFCTISVNVTSATPGTHTNVTGDLTSSAGNSGTAAANLVVNPNAPGFSKNFSPSIVNFGERSTLTFTIDNSLNALGILNSNFSDILPPGVIIASPSNISSSCSNINLTANPGSSVINAISSGFTEVVAAGGICTISVDVIGAATGTHVNVTGNLNSFNSSFQNVNSGKASASIEVLPASKINLSKSFSDNPISPGGTTSIDFTISNFDRNFGASNIAFTDDLSAFLPGTIATGLPISNTCGVGSMISGTNIISLTGASLPPEGSCTFSVPILIPAGSTAGIYTNTTSAITADINGTPFTGNIASENLSVYDVPIITKTFLSDPVLAGATTTLEFTITNTSATEPLTDITFNDNISSFLSGTTISSLPAANSCGIGSTFFSQLIGSELHFVMNGGNIAAGSSCTFSIDLLIPVAQASGTYTNTSSLLAGNVAGQAVSGAAASDNLTIISVPTFTKSFTNDPVLPGETVNLEFTIQHDMGAGGDATALSFTDDLNAVIPGLVATGLPLTDVCGVGSSISGTSNLSLIGGTVAEGSSCTFSVPVSVPTSAIPGNYTNTTSSLNSTIAGQVATSNPAIDDLIIGGLEFTKEFIGGSVLPGELTTLRFTIENTSTFDATNMIFTDNLGSFIPGLVAEAPLPTDPCGTGSLLNGTSFIIFSNGNLTAGNSCSFDVPVRVPAGTSNGTYINTTSNLSVTLNGLTLILAPATDNLVVNDELIEITKTFTNDPATPGSTVNVEYTLTNLDVGNAISNIAFTEDFDGLYTGLAATGLPMNDICGVGSQISGTGMVSFTGGSLAAGSSCTFSIELSVPAGIPYGTTLSCPTSAVTGTLGGFPVAGTPASDDLNITSLSFSKSINGPVIPGESTTITFTINNNDPLTTYSDIEFSDDLNAFIPGMLATDLPKADICGVGSILGGTSTINFSRGILLGGGMCSFDVTVMVPCNATAGMFTNTTSNLTSVSNGGISVEPAMADLLVNAGTTANFPALSNYCLDDGIQNIAGGATPTGGVYSGVGVTDSGDGLNFTFNPSTAGVGIETITYTDATTCMTMATSSIEVYALPTVSFIAIADLCIDAGIQTGLGGSSPAAAGGIFSGPGVTDGGDGIVYSFNPTTAGVGTHTLIYTYTDGNSCINSASEMVEVFALPVVTFTAPADLCIDAGIQTGLGGGTPPQGTVLGDNGIYSGSGVTDDGNGMTYSFNPATAGVGTHTLTYSYTDENSCTASSSDMIEVFVLPTVLFTAPADLCINIGVQSSLGGATPTGGVYSGPGVVDDGNGMTYSFNPATAGVGTHTLTYSYTDSNTCSDSETDMIEVFATPTVSFTAPSDLCIDAGIQTGLSGGTPPEGTALGDNGIYSGTGVTDDGNGMTYSFNPATAGVGTHTLTYTYTNENGCIASAIDMIEVFALPVVAFTAPADLCIDAGTQTGLGGGTPPQGTTVGDNGIYSGPGVTDDGNGMTYSFNPLTAGVGTHTLTYSYTDENTCIASASDMIEVFVLPAITFTAPADLCINIGVQSSLGGAIPDGGVYSGPGVTDDGNGMTYSFNPITAGVGTHTLTYTYTDSNTCSDSETDMIEVFATPTVSFTASSDFCIDAGIQTGLSGGTPPEGTSLGDNGIYSGTGITDDGNGMTYSFNPATAGVGTHTLTYTYTNENGCIASAIDMIEVFALPVVAFTAPADLCIDAGTQTGLGGGTPPQGTTVGDNGIYSGTGVVDDGNGMTYSFNPATAGVGTHTLTYSYTDENACIASASDMIEVFVLPTVSFTAPADLCINIGVQSSLGGATPTGGVYSGSGVVDDGNGMTYSFDPSTAGVGTHTLTYTYTDSNTCSDSETDMIEVFAVPTVSFTASSDFCIDVGIQTGLSGGTPPEGTALGDNGIYSGTGVSDDGNGMTYSFNPATAGVGTHTLTYTYTNENGCIASASDMIEVFALPVVAFTAPADLCIDAGTQTGLGGGTPPEGTTIGDNGIYSGTGVVDDGNGMTYSFNPATAGVGTHTLTYSYTDENACISSASDMIEVFVLPTVSFTAPADLCINIGVQSSLGGATPTGGVYSGTGVVDDGNGMTYSFNPATAGVGTHTLTYTYVDSNTCSDSQTDMIEVFAAPSVSYTAPADLCINVGVQSNLGGGLPIGGTYSGTGITDDGNGMTYSFNPATAGAGIHTLTYSFTNVDGCNDTASDDVEVFDISTVTFTAPADLCVDSGNQTGLGSGLPAGGTYSGNGVVDGGDGMTYSFDPATAGVGVHTITYTFTNTNSCTDTVSDDVEVFALPIVSVSTPSNVCIDAGLQSGLGGGLPTGGIYSGTGITDDGDGMTYSIDPLIAGAGITTIVYTYTDGNSCTDLASTSIEIYSLPVVSIIALADLCINIGTQTGLSGGTPTGAGGVYSGSGITDDGNGMTYSFDPTTAGVGVHTISYAYTDGNACVNSASDDVEVFAVPTVTFTTVIDQCENIGILTSQSGGLPTGGIYTGAGVTDDGNGMTYSFDPATATPGTHTITYTYTTTDGCIGSASDDVEVFEAPTCTAAEISPISCVGLSDGSATVSAADGDGNYLYLWENGETTMTATMLDDGSHTVTVTDGNACSSSCTVVITTTVDITPPEFIDCQTTPFTYTLDMDGAINIPTSDYYFGATDNCSASANISLSGAMNDFTCADIGSNIFTLTVTDEAVNTATCEVEIIIVEPIAVFNPMLTSECSMTGLNIDLNDFVDNGVTGLTYSWLATENTNVTGETTTATSGNLIADVIINTSGAAEIITYTVTPTSSNGCVYAPFQVLVEIFSEIIAEVSCGCAINSAGTQVVPVITLTGISGGIPTTDGSSYSLSSADGTFLNSTATLNGSAILEMTLLTGGNYTVTITDDAGCELVITDTCLDCSFDEEFSSVDPCSCNGDQSENGAMDGSFNETVQIMGPSGFTLILGAGSVGMLDAEVGDVFNEITPGVYEFSFDHLDNIGYSIFAELLLVSGATIPLTDITGNQITETNACQYPILDNPIIDQLDFCFSDDGISVTGATSEIQGHPGTITATINGVVITDFNPSTWGTGIHRIQWTFIGDFVSNQGGTTADPAIPGSLDCATYVTQDVLVHSGGQLACNNHINVSVDQDCGLGFFTADMFMEGATDDQFFNFQVLGINDIPVELNNVNDPNYIGNYVGQTLTYEVFDVCSGNNCWGLITLQDKIAPTLDCECETPYLADGITPNPDCTLKCFEVWDLENLEAPGRNNELLPDPNDSAPEDNCIEFGDPIVAISYRDGINCSEQIVVRDLLWTYVDENGAIQELRCVQNFLFDNLDINSIGSTTNGAWDGYPDIFTANAGDAPLSDIYTPEQIIFLPCGADTDPASIATIYDIDTPGRPSGIDRDDYSNDTETPNIIEHQEGYAYAYPYVVTAGWSGRYHAKPIDNNICEIYSTFTDLSYDACAEDCYGNSKIARTWTILDWCTASTVEFVQTIKRLDTEGPTVSGPDFEISVDPWGCTANFEVPNPEHLMDNCDKNPTWSIIAPTGISVINGIVQDLPKGITSLSYVAEDCCGNINYSSFNVTVVDKTAPVAIAKQDLVIQLTNIIGSEGYAKIYAKDVDNFSHDGCTDVHLEIRRGDDKASWCGPNNDTFNNDGHDGDHPDDTDNGEFVEFCCVDLFGGGFFGDAEVILRVWDDGDMDGVFGSAGDNYNETWVTVKVEDKLDPIVVCPPHIELSCHEDFLDYDLTGKPYASGTCFEITCDNEPSDSYRKKPTNSAPFAGEEIAAYNPSCRRGAIQRTWSCEGKTCTQWIIMRDTEDGELDITWPEDQTSNCLGFDAGEPDVVERLCELSGTSLQSDTFYFEDGACYKILNHWSIINWCDYDAADSDLNDQTDIEDDGLIPGLYTHTQVLKLIDTEKPTLTLQDTCFAVNADCVGEGMSVWAGASDNGICASAWLKWEVEVDMNSDWDIDYTYSSWLAPSDDFYLAPTAGDIHVNLPDGLSNGCSSKHRLRWTVSDGCGNDTQGTSFFTIEDKKKPTPYMLNLSTALMEDGSVELWAKDFDAGSFDNCTPQEFLVYTFSSTVPYQLIDPSEEDPWYDVDGAASENDYNNGNAELWDGEQGTSAMVFTDQDLADAQANGGLLDQSVYVWDLCGNKDFAIVNLQLIDNGGTAYISGRVTTESGIGVAGVTMSALSEQVGYPANATTSDNGEYTFDFNPMYNDYTIEGEKNDDWLNGVTTLDLVLIQRHILGLTDLDSPYKLIAADASNDERVSAIDLIQIRKLILGIYEELPANDSWRFTDADASMNESNPWPFSEFVDVLDLEDDMNEDFIGVKVGDVNGSVISNLQNNSTELRSNKQLELNINKTVLPDDVTNLSFKSSNFEQVAGFQLSLEMDASDILSIESGAIEFQEGNIALVDGTLVISWHVSAGDLMSVDNGVELFNISVTGIQNNSILISDKIIKSEAYQGNNLEFLDVVLSGKQITSNRLLQNEPNPFREQTIIGFSLSEGGLTTISIYDLTGKMIHMHVEDYKSGDNKYILKSKDLNSTGVFYYKIENEDFTTTKKMIFVR